MSWRVLFKHRMLWALVLALARAGKSMPAKMAMMAMTTNSSMSVNPRFLSDRSIDFKPAMSLEGGSPGIAE